MSHDQLLEMSQRVSVRPATSIDDLHRDRIAALRYKGYRCFDSVTSPSDAHDAARSARRAHLIAQRAGFFHLRAPRSAGGGQPPSPLRTLRRSACLGRASASRTRAWSSGSRPSRASSM